DSESLELKLVPSLDNMFYGNVNEIITNMMWVDEDYAIGLRYNATRPKDLVLLNRNNLIVDSLSINLLFLDKDRVEQGSFISIQMIVEASTNEFMIVHNYGTSLVSVDSGKFELLEKKISKEKPSIPKSFLEDHVLINLGRFTIGYRSEMKYLNHADFWVYDWELGTHEFYEDSKYKEASKNWYWKLKGTPETYSSTSIFRYSIIATKDGFIFNLPLKNRFLTYTTDTGKFQSHTFPPLEKKSQAWFAFYDRKLDRVYAVLDTGKEYRINALDTELRNFYFLASSIEQPFGVLDGRVYLREVEFKEKNKTWFCNHYLVNLYPKL
ncbi:MAG: hypothetical protein ABJ333_12600, partial [Algoriphagus sp.]